MLDPEPPIGPQLRPRDGESTRIWGPVTPPSPQSNPDRQGDLKVFFWPAHTEDGCFRYRVEMQRDELLRLGHEVQTSRGLGPWPREVADVLVGQRVCMGNPTFAWQMLAAEARVAGRRRMVFEIDDDLLHIDRDNPLGAEFRNPAVHQNLLDNIRAADLVTVSTEPLRRSLLPLNRNIVVLPNSLPDGVFDITLSTRRGRDTTPLIIGWQGSSTHGPDWAMIAPAVRDVLDSTDHVRVMFLGVPYGTGLPLDKLLFKPWTTDLMVHLKRSAQFDIGLAPLRRTPFNDAKSGIKFMEGAALGVPMICSDVPPYADLVEHGVTGFLAGKSEQWGKYLRMLINDSAMRLEIGDNARATARHWVIGERIHLWEEAYRSLKD